MAQMYRNCLTKFLEYCSVYKELFFRALRRRRGRYSNWLKLYDTEPDLASIEHPSNAPLFSILMPVFNPDLKELRAAIVSVRKQTYGNWELCIVDDCSSSHSVREAISELASADARIKTAFRSENGNISEATNTAFDLATGEWIGLLDQDDVLHQSALAVVSRTIRAHPSVQVIYTDEDKIGERGNRFQPYFKPDFSLELLRAQNYLNHFTVHRAANIYRVGKWRKEFDGSQDYDLNLRIVESIADRDIIHIPFVLYHWRATNGSTAHSIQNKAYAVVAGQRALQAHISRLNLDAQVVVLDDVPYYRTRHRLPTHRPLVSIIIPTRDNIDVLKKCINSILHNTTYDRYEIILVDNGSTSTEAISYLNYLSGNGAATVLNQPGDFNYSKLNNDAAKIAAGDVLCLLNNDIEVLSPDWLEELVSIALQDGVGCVGPKLLYPEGRIQHAGVVTGIGGVAGHPYKYYKSNHPGYFSNLRLHRNVSAVTGACMVMTKKVFEEVGGLDEANLAVAFNDVDLCLRAIEAGYRNVFTPFSTLVHHESLTRGKDNTPEKVQRFRKEVNYMHKRWGERLVNDPWYSNNLTLAYEDYSLAFPPRTSRKY
ncbi:glycosyltransferase family 2 protein [Ensifer sp. ZNC0028]|uniref:glycosyltransferase family 2 protein n=2 Tax=unclassified Ensifer TaxID=2633371 RepID=UPI0018CFC701|nr:glycosyltransferase family 2 protein [Ensifer sp. ZNC0028]